MPSQYNLYVANFNRVRLSEMLDRHEFETRRNRVKASLVVNPLSGHFYGEAPPTAKLCGSSVPV